MRNENRRLLARVLLVACVAAAHVFLPTLVTSLAPSFSAPDRSASTVVHLVPIRTRSLSQGNRPPNSTPSSTSTPSATVNSPPNREVARPAPHRSEPATSHADAVASPDASESAEPTQAATASSAELSPSGYLEYSLTGRLESQPLSGSARLGWAINGDQYKLSLNLTASRHFTAWLVEAMVSEGRIVSTHLQPMRYEVETQLAGRQATSQAVTFDTTEPPIGGDAPLAPFGSAADPLSLVFQLGKLLSDKPELLNPGAQVPISLNWQDHVVPDHAEVLGPEVLQSPFGPIETIRLASHQAGEADASWTIDIWFAPAWRHSPVRLRLSRDTGDYLDLAISRRPDGG